MTYFVYREDLAWAGGYFEGEGCFSACQRKGRDKTPQLRADLNNTDLGMLERFAGILQVGRIYGPYARGTNKPMYRWAASGYEPFQFVLASLWTFLSPRRQSRGVELIHAYRAAA